MKKRVRLFSLFVCILVTFALVNSGFIFNNTADAGLRKFRISGKIEIDRNGNILCRGVPNKKECSFDVFIFIPDR